MKINIFGYTPDQLSSVVSSLNMPSFTATQLADWMYHKQVYDFSQMTNLPKQAREKLDEKYVVELIAPSNVQESVDGTKKYLYPTVHENKFIEAAYIPDGERATLCVSTQVGCKMGCLFCMTGKQGFQGNLTAGEILNQVQSLPEFGKLTNIVYMGMGEPLDNVDEVLRSIEVMTSAKGYGWSPKRITVSTVGIIPAMIRFLKESQAHLAVSLHSPFDDERRGIMPIQSVYSLSEVLLELKKWDLGLQRRISFEYIMFKGVNDTPRHAAELVRILHGLRCRINLIRFHAIPDTPLVGTDYEHMVGFQNILKARGMTVTIRASRGEDIFAACGMLSTKELIKRQQNTDY